jgi:hypothetical protein
MSYYSNLILQLVRPVNWASQPGPSQERLKSVAGEGTFL